MTKIDEKIKIIRDEASFKICNSLFKKENSNAPINFFEIGRALISSIDLIRDKSIYNFILDFLDKICLPKGYSLKVELYNEKEEKFYSRLYVKLPNGEIDYNIYKHLIIEESPSGAWQVVLLNNLIYVLPTENIACESYKKFIFNEYEKEFIRDSFDELDYKNVMRNLKTEKCNIKVARNQEFYYVSCCYWSDFVGFCRDYFEVQIRDNKVLNINLIKEDILYEYNCGLVL